MSSSLYETLRNLIATAGPPTIPANTGGIADGPIYEALCAARATLRNPEGTLPWWRVRDLQQQAIIEHEVDGLALEPSYSIIATLTEAGTAPFLSFDHRAEWITALQAAAAYNRAFPTFYVQQDEATYRHQHGRALNVARSVLALRSAGFSLSMTDGKPADLAELRVIEEALLGRIQEDPQSHLALFLVHLQDRYDEHQNRYRFTRVLVDSIHVKEKGAIPLGHLYIAISTALREISRSRPALTPAEDARVDETWNLYTAYAGVIDVEMWSIFETLFADPSSILQKLVERVRFEQTFMIRQQTPAQSLKLCDRVFAPFTAESYATQLPYPIDDALSVMRVIFRHHTRVSPLLFTADDMAQASTLPLERVLSILQSFAFDGSKSVADLSFFDLSAGDVMYRPLIRLENDTFVLIDRLLAGPAFYEAIASAYREALPKGTLDEVLGKEGLENAIKSLLNERGIKVICGKYGMDDLECDAVVESQDSVIFIEAKKKGLTRKSLAGQPETVLFDVSKSLLEAQVQLARHEYFLRRDGLLSFHDGHVLTLGNRRIDRVAITLLDLGSLQDKMVLSNILSNLRGARLRTDRPLDQEARRANRSFEETADELAKYHGLTSQLVPDYGLVERFIVRSYALVEFMELLSDVTSVEDLAANLAVDRHMTTGIGEWIAEYRHLKTLLAPSQTG